MNATARQQTTQLVTKAHLFTDGEPVELLHRVEVRGAEETWLCQIAFC